MFIKSPIATCRFWQGDRAWSWSRRHSVRLMPVIKGGTLMAPETDPSAPPFILEVLFSSCTTAARWRKVWTVASAREHHCGWTAALGVCWLSEGTLAKSGRWERYDGEWCGADTDETTLARFRTIRGHPTASGTWKNCLIPIRDVFWMRLDNDARL